MVVILKKNPNEKQLENLKNWQKLTEKYMRLQ